MILLDTHAAIWLANNDPALGKVSRSMALAARDGDELAISAISFWEISMLFAKGRIALHASPAELRADLLGTGVLEQPLTGSMAIVAVGLAGLHNDPADRFIAATAIANDATLITADKRLLNWRHRLKRQDASK